MTTEYPLVIDDNPELRPVENTQALVRQDQSPAPPKTAAQAKIDAVASITMKAYERAGSLQLTTDEITALKADFPDEAFKPGAAGKENLLYIEHAFLRDRFNDVFGMGGWSMVPRSRWAEPFKTQRGVEGSRVYVEAMLVVRGCFVAESIGEMEYYPSNASQNYGDACEGAETASFRRCAKKFGVGLQAWKKDWCESWWARKRGQRPVTTPPAPQTPAMATQTPPKEPLYPTEESKARFLAKLKALEGVEQDKILEYYRKLDKPSALLKTENLEDLPLEFVPVSLKQWNDLVLAVLDFQNGLPLRHAFTPNYNPSPEAQKGSVPVTTTPPGAGPEGHTYRDEVWYKVIVTIPRKGQKKADYLKAPDTIGSLFEARHGNDDEAQAARQRLFGLVYNWEPTPWTNPTGKTFAPSDADKKLRVMLDAFKDYWEREHPGEKL